jgi:hypothetical protein
MNPVSKHIFDELLPLRATDREESNELRRMADSYGMPEFRHQHGSAADRQVSLRPPYLFFRT